VAGRYRIGEAVAWECVRWLVLGVSWIPGIAGVAVRWVVLRPLIGTTDGPFRVLERVTIEFPSRLKLGKHVGLNQGVWINARGGVELGANAIVGPYCVIHSANHVTSDPTLPIRLQGYAEAPVRIGADVWLGAHVTVLPGVTIGDGCVVGAGAVVTRDLPEGTVAVGVPAKPISMRGQTSPSR